MVVHFGIIFLRKILFFINAYIHTICFGEQPGRFFKGDIPCDLRGFKNFQNCPRDLCPDRHLHQPHMNQHIETDKKQRDKLEPQNENQQVKPVQQVR